MIILEARSKLGDWLGQLEVHLMPCVSEAIVLLDRLKDLVVVHASENVNVLCVESHLACKCSAIEHGADVAPLAFGRHRETLTSTQSDRLLRGNVLVRESSNTVDEAIEKHREVTVPL